MSSISITDLFNQHQLQKHQQPQQKSPTRRARSIKDISDSTPSSASVSQPDLPNVTSNGNEDPQLFATLPHSPVHLRNETVIMELISTIKTLKAKTRQLHEEEQYWRNMMSEQSYTRISQLIEGVQVKQMNEELQLQTREAMKQLKQSISSASEHSVDDQSCDDLEKELTE